MSTSPETARRADILRASPEMFESRLLNKLSRVHPSVPLIIFLPAIAIFLVLGIDRVGPLQAVAWVIGGYAFWTLTEYWLHRIVFHFEPDHALGRRLHWIIHGVHHDHPNDPMRLVMPPSVSVPLAALFYLLFVWVLGPERALPMGAGFFAGYLAYDMTHYYVHHFKPRGPIGRKLRELHMRHHFQDGTRGFGVSAPYWDKVFGTAPRARKRAG
jgi:sterol desaturase/sphingolipid hydroxylase (fatty acid hydroxylase superfamily)